MMLSMWILADRLGKYRPMVAIRDGEQVLRSARILSADTRIEPQNVYLTLVKGSQRGKVLCVHGRDMLLLDTADIDGVLNEILDAFDYYSSWADGLRQDISDGCGLQHLVERSYDVFREPMVVFDAALNGLAYTTQYGPDDVDGGWKRIVQTGNSSSGALGKGKDRPHPSSNYRRDVQELNAPFFNNMNSLQKLLFHEKAVVGRIVLLEFHRREGKGTMQLLDILGSLIELWLDRGQGERRAESDVFRELLEGVQVPARELDYKLSMRGWEARQEKLLLKLEVPVTYKDSAHALLSQLERLLPDCYAFFHREYIYILVNPAYTPWEDVERELKGLLDGCIFHCAVSYPFCDLLRLPAAAAQCRLTLQFALDKQGGIYHCGDHAPDYIRNVVHTAIDPAVVHPALHALKRNDEENQNDLYGTLRVYLGNNCNLAHTARAMNLHRNTLLYRLNKIRGLVDLDLDVEAVREYLRLSYIILEG